MPLGLRFVQAKPQGREIHYELKFEKMQEIDKWLEQLRKIWETRFDQLDNLLEKIKDEKDEKSN